MTFVTNQPGGSPPPIQCPGKNRSEQPALQMQYGAQFPPLSFKVVNRFIRFTGCFRIMESIIQASKVRGKSLLCQADGHCALPQNSRPAFLSHKRTTSPRRIQHCATARLPFNGPVSVRERRLVRRDTGASEEPGKPFPQGARCHRGPDAVNLFSGWGIPPRPASLRPFGQTSGRPQGPCGTAERGIENRNPLPDVIAEKPLPLSLSSFVSLENPPAPFHRRGHEEPGRIS